MVSLCGRKSIQMDEISFEYGEAQKFSYQSLQIATNNFSNHNIIKRDGFAKVYRGVLPNGTLIAVRKYRPERTEHLEIPRMVEVLSCVRHPNIDRIIGYCIHNNQWLLVSEHFGNGSLRELLDNKEKRESVYHLHEQTNPCVIHRDIKTSNILFDSNFTPQIIDFDDAKKAIERGSYGGDIIHLSEWALDLLANDRVSEVVDPALVDFPMDQVLSFIDVAFSCIELESRLRPSMGEVMQMLNGVCNPWRQPFTFFEMQPNNCDTPYLSAASSFKSSTDQTYNEGEGESSIVESEEIDLQAQEEIEDTITIATQQQNMGFAVSGSGDLVERLSQTMVFERSTVNQGEFAAYRRKKNMMPRNKA